MSSFEADTLKRIAPEEWDSYQDIHDRAMVDLVRDPRYVVYAADALIAKLVAAVEERDRMLRLAGDWCEHVNWDGEGLDKEAWLADLRARAARDCEEGK